VFQNIDDWVEACRWAAALLDRNRKAFERAVRREAQRRYKSQFMAQINKARDTFWKEGYNRGFAEAKKRYEVWLYCSICGGKAPLLPNSEEYKDLVEFLLEVEWAHESCIEKEQKQAEGMF